MKRTPQLPARAALAAAICLLAPAGAYAAAAKTKPPVMDFTQGGQPDTTHDWTLGATGARGWMWGWRGHTFDARQILITAVDADSPADGVLAKGDVILGVAGKAFDGDAREQFARAVTEAEKEGNRGRLKLIRWRPFGSAQGKKGKTENVELDLAVMGTYSDTAPYGCAKSRKIFDLGCQAIARKGLDPVSIPTDLNALALLASGKDEYKPLLAEYARKVADLHLEGMATWHYGYANIFLAEYYLATGDKSILPGLKRIAMEAARGQSNVGTWGHKFSRPDGILNGYGAMNQPGLSLIISMLLARQAGVNDPQLDRAIAKSVNFLRWYVNKGAIPYGDHGPWPDHEDNGKCSSAAVMFDLVGDAEAAGFFARMGLAAWAERESGHTGCFFNMLWAMPGVSRGGRQAAAEYFKINSWHYDLARRWDGSFIYQGTPANWNGHSHRNWDCTGLYLLAYALADKSLYLTGKKPSCVPAFTDETIASTIKDGSGFTFWNKDTCYDAKPLDELFACLSSWSPAVRNRAAKSLSKRTEDVTPRLLSMLDSADANTRYGACVALKGLGPRATRAGAKLRDLLGDNDPWVRSLAAQAINAGAVDDRNATAVELLTRTTQRASGDPRETVQRSLGSALFAKRSRRTSQGGVLGESLEGVDRKLLYPAIRRLLANEDPIARGHVGKIYPLLTDADLQVLLPDILAATDKMAPSNTMFADGIRLMGLDLLSSRRITEGMALCIKVIEFGRWGAGRRVGPCLKYLSRYGAAARPALPELRTMRETLVKNNRRNRNDAHIKAIDEIIAKINSSSKAPKLQTVAEFIKNPAPKP